MAVFIGLNPLCNLGSGSEKDIPVLLEGAELLMCSENAGTLMFKGLQRVFRGMQEMECCWNEK